MTRFLILEISVGHAEKGVMLGRVNRAAVGISLRRLAAAAAAAAAPPVLRLSINFFRPRRRHCVRVRVLRIGAEKINEHRVCGLVEVA